MRPDEIKIGHTYEGSDGERRTSRVSVERTALPGGEAWREVPMSLVLLDVTAERDALRAEVERLTGIVGNPDTYEALLFENQELRVEVDHLRCGIEAYRKYEMTPHRVIAVQGCQQQLADARDAIHVWERDNFAMRVEEGKRDAT